jgi:hypothetical protein
MMEVVCLTEQDRRLLAARFGEHGNSLRRMKSALVEAGARAAAERLVALRQLERRYNVDLGEICHRYGRRNQPDTHPIERFVMSYIAEERAPPHGRPELWVLLDRLRQVRELMEGRLVGEPES